MVHQIKGAERWLSTLVISPDASPCVVILDRVPGHVGIMVGSALCRESGHRPSQLGVALRPQGRSGPLEEAAQSKEPKVYTLRQPFRVESISEFLVPGAWIGDAADCGMLNMTEDSPWWRDLPRTRSGSARTEGRLAALVIARRKRATVWNALQGCETAPGMQWTVTVADKPAYAVSFSTQPSKLVISNYGFFSSRPSLSPASV